MEYMTVSELDILTLVSELESLGIETPQLNDLNDSYEIGNLIENLKQMYIQDYKSNSTFTD
jgi:hypothetical protein